MKSYYKGTHSVRKTAIFIRVLIIIACCAAVFALTVLLGDHLLKKAEQSSVHGSGTYVEPDPTAPETAGKTAEYTAKRELSPESLRHNCAYIDVTAGEDGDTPFKQIDDAFTRGSDGIVIVIRDGNGQLLYSCRPLTSIFGVRYDPALPDADTLSEYVEYAKRRMMTVSAVFETCGSLGDSDLVLYDEMIVSELSAIGFDEIILTGVFDRIQPSAEGVADYLSYLTRLRANAPMIRYGVVTDSSMFGIAVLAPLFEDIYKYTDIMLADLRKQIAESDDPAAAVSQFHNTLTGSIAHYNLRVITDISVGDEALLTALADNALTNRTEIPSPVENADG